MSKRLKTLIIVTTSTIVLILICGYFALTIIGGAFGSECEKSNSWIVGQYEIQEYKCLGWAGPNYYPLELFKNGEKITRNGLKLDSCRIHFVPRNDLYLKLNICNKQLTELTPDKKRLNFKQIDSIVLVNLELKQSRKLGEGSVKHFIEKWNEASVFDFRDNEKPFYPSSLYYYKVYQNGSERVFETGNFMIKDADNWSYSFLEKGEETSTKKFDEMWNKLKTIDSNHGK